MEPPTLMSGHLSRTYCFGYWMWFHTTSAQNSWSEILTMCSSMLRPKQKFGSNVDQNLVGMRVSSSSFKRHCMTSQCPIDMHPSIICKTGLPHLCGHCEVIQGLVYDEDDTLVPTKFWSTLDPNFCFGLSIDEHIVNISDQLFWAEVVWNHIQ